MAETVKIVNMFEKKTRIVEGLKTRKVCKTYDSTNTWIIGHKTLKNVANTLYEG